MEIFKRIIKSLNYHLRNTLFLDKYEKNYIKHNVKTWKDFKIDNNSSKRVILVDLFEKKSLIHIWSYLANILAKKTNSRIEHYYLTLYKGPTSRIEFFRHKLLKIFKSFNAEEGINEQKFDYTNKEIIFFQKKFDQVKNSKSKIANFTIDNIKLGDLIYDSYLRTGLKKTIDIKDELFKKIFFRTLKIYLVTKKYFRKNKVVALIPSHTCYYYGIIARIAAKNDVPILKVNTENKGNENFRINLVDQKYVNEEAAPYFHFRKIFRKLPQSEKKRGLIIGKKILQNRIKGNYDETIPYMKISQFNKGLKKTNLIKNNNKKKIFIFPHCYFDNVHRYRHILFHDFEEQVNFLLKLSKKYSNYEWYYKPHPHEIKSDMNVHIEMLAKYPNVTLLDSKVGHNQIIKSKPFCIFTNHGTVGHEYAAFKIPVIFTGDNKHINYKFGLHAKSKKQIEQAIRDDKFLKKNIIYNKKDLYEFIYMNYVHFRNLYEREKLIKDSYFNTKDLSISDTSKCYEHLVKTSKESHNKIISYIENIIRSEDLKKYLP